MISPATAYAASTVGNAAMCIALPREQTAKIYLNGTQIAKNDEAVRQNIPDEASRRKPRRQSNPSLASSPDPSSSPSQETAWKFFGIAAAQAAAGLFVADKLASSAEDKKMVNGAIAAGALGNVALFSLTPFAKDTVKPEMRGINLAMQAGVAGLAIKSLLDNGSSGGGPSRM